MQLFEKYRPASWKAFVGNEKAIGRLLAVRDRSGFQGRAYWFSGPSGIGKTTAARLVAKEIAHADYIEEYDATALTESVLNEAARRIWLRGHSADQKGRVYIVNEAHGLRKAVIRRLLVLLENIPPHAAWIFTTTSAGQEALFEDYDDAGPLISRCLPVKLSSQGIALPGAQFVQAVAVAEGLDGKPIKDYVRLMNDCKNNIRQALSEVEAGRMLDA